MRQKVTANDILSSKAGRLNTHLTKLLPDEKKGLKGLKTAKYRNEWKVVDGIKFQSKKEAKRYCELKSLTRTGKISLLQLQREYVLIPKNGKERECKYKADFVYYNHETSEWIVEDVKSPATRKLSTYIIKRKLMKQVYGIEIKEV